eukprot:SAG31_NODE_602_length_13638_cov_32.936037_2_plen_63_part_00
MRLITNQLDRHSPSAFSDLRSQLRFSGEKLQAKDLEKIAVEVGCTSEQIARASQGDAGVPLL